MQLERAELEAMTCMERLEMNQLKMSGYITILAFMTSLAIAGLGNVFATMPLLLISLYMSWNTYTKVDKFIAVVKERVNGKKPESK